MTVVDGKFHNGGAGGGDGIGCRPRCRPRCTETCPEETKCDAVGRKRVLACLACLLVVCAPGGATLVWSWGCVLACFCVRLMSFFLLLGVLFRLDAGQCELWDVVTVSPALALAYSPADGAGVLLALAGPAARVAFWVFLRVAAGLCIACVCGGVLSVVLGALRLVARARARAWAQPAAVAYHGTSLEQGLAVRAGPAAGLLGWALWSAPRASGSLHTALARARAAGAASSGGGPAGGGPAGAEGHGVVFRLEEYPGPRARVTAVLFTDTVRAARLGYEVRAGPQGYEVRRAGAGRKGAPATFYHGTPALENVLAIQRGGFDVGRSGANAGQMLGPGVYVTTSLEKAMNYAREGGAVFRLEVDLGRCAQLVGKSGLCSWQTHYDSAWAPRGLIGEREENCVRDPRRVRVRDVLLVAPAEAARENYRVVDRRLQRPWWR